MWTHEGKYGKDNYRQFHIRQNPDDGGWYAEQEATGRKVVEGFVNPEYAGKALVQTLAREGVDVSTVQTEIHY